MTLFLLIALLGIWLGGALMLTLASFAGAGEEIQWIKILLWPLVMVKVAFE
jgi:hypothetical protein